MADENIMSLIQNLFVEDNSSLVNSHQGIDLSNENKFTGFSNEIGSNFSNANHKTLDNDLNASKKLLIKQLHSQISQTNQYGLNTSQQQQQNATSFFNDLTMNPVLRNLTMKDQTDLNDEMLFANKMFPSLNGMQSQLSKANYDLLNNNTTSTNQIIPQTTTAAIVEQHHQTTTVIKDIPISPLSDCSFKSKLLTPGGPTSLNANHRPASQSNLYSNFSLINNNSNNVLLQQNNSALVSTTSNLLSSNLINSPIANNSNNLSHSASTVNSFADIILGNSCGADDSGIGGQSLVNSYGLNNVVQRAAAQQQFVNEQSKFVDTCASPDSFIYTEEDRFESQVRSLANEIHSTIQLHMNGLHMRREGLLQQLEHIKKIYLDVLRKKKAAINGSKQQQLFTKQEQTNLKQLEKFVLPSITFNKPDSALYKAISQLGFLNTPAFGPFCTASGDGLEFAVPGVNSTFTVETRNCFNDELLVGRESVSIEILALFNDNTSANQFDGKDSSVNSTNLESNSSLTADLAFGNKKSSPSLLDYTSKSTIPHTFFDHNNGKYTVTYNVPILKSIPQELVIKINVNSLPINDSPIRVPVQTQKRQNWKLATTFGSEGNAIGLLARPWGVAIVKMPAQLLMNHQNNSLISQQANGQQTNDLQQQMIIETVSGTRTGMFDRPAGICINLGLGHIIVADKDNHRIQVFSLTGRYLFKFGEKGNRIGQFNYPWDLDSCANTHQIAVSDTRNRRIQLFTPYGQYVNHFSLLLDSPRGVSFLPDKRLVVSDFNKHRILIFDKFICNPNLNNKDGSMGNDLASGFTNLNSPKIIGFGEGSAWGEFLRPQGVAASGNAIFCADSRNNRICIYNMLTQTFEYLSEELNLDRPSDLSVIDENLLVIIDFGNNRLQIFQR